jgi:tRNA threonylcarbamoyladenosine biosynthesis protein TsaB
LIVLALDTCLAACSVALMRDGETLGVLSEPTARGHQERLAPMTRDLMAGAGLEFPALDRIGVTVGPGSFTGLRVGLAFAKGLAFALRRPCVGVGTLEALAASLEADGPKAAVIDAGRGRVYLQLFDGPASLSGPDILTVETAAARLFEVFASFADVALTGPGAELLAGALPGAAVRPLPAPDPRAVARLAAAAPLSPPRPLYLRPPDATAKAA